MVAVQSASKVGPKAECHSQNGGLQTALPARWGVFSHTETAIRLAEQSSNTKKKHEITKCNIHVQMEHSRDIAAMKFFKEGS